MTGASPARSYRPLCLICAERMQDIAEPVAAVGEIQAGPADPLIVSDSSLLIISGEISIQFNKFVYNQEVKRPPEKRANSATFSSGERHDRP